MKIESMQNATQADTVIQRLRQWAEQHDEIRALLITSTRAIPNAAVDLLSDYDMILVVRDIRPFHAERSWLHAFGEVLVTYWDPIQRDPAYDEECFGNVILYQDGLHIDFTLWPVALLQHIVAAPALPAELDAGYRILLDKDGLTTGMAPPTHQSYIPTPPTAETFQRWVEEFFSDVPYVAKCLWRDELLPVKWVLDYDMKHIYLLPMLEWRLEIEHGWAMKTGVLGRGLKKRLPPHLWRQLENSYAGAGIEENWEALFNTIALFRQAAQEVAAHFGYAYPHDLDQGVVAYIQQIRRLARPV